MDRDKLILETFELSREIGYQYFLAKDFNRDDPVLTRLNPEERTAFLRDWWDEARDEMYQGYCEQVANLSVRDLLNWREDYVEVLDAMGITAWRQEKATEGRNSLEQILTDNAEKKNRSQEPERATDKGMDLEMKTIRFREWDCVVEKSQYGNGRPALILNDAHDGEQIAVATVNLPNVAAGPNEVFIKDYSENEGVLKALLEAGVVKLTGETVSSGFVAIPKVELLPPFRERSLADTLADKTVSPAQEFTERSKDKGREM
jgi:Domain of unknown function (DUF4313)